MKMKKIYLYVSIFFFILGGLLSHTYRVYIYSNDIFDFHLADTIGNLVGVSSAACFFIAISKKEINLKKFILEIVLAFCVFECMGLLGLHGVFDWYDIIATIISGVITYFVLKKINKFPQL